MPQFFNPASHDENISIFEAQKSTPSSVEQKINIINFRDETVGFKTKKIESYGSKPIDKYVDDPIYTDKFLLFGHFGIGYALANGINPDFFYLFNIRNPLNRLLSNYYRNKKLNDNEIGRAHV